MSREGRAQPIQPFATHGFLGNIPPNGVLPGVVTVVDSNDDRRRKTLPLPPVILNGLYSIQQAPTVAPPAPVNVNRDDRRKPAPDPVAEHGFPADQYLPPAPFVVPLEERRRFLAQLPPTVLRGYDNVEPPEEVGAPELYVVEPDDKRRRRQTPDPISLLGVPVDQFAPFVKPPAPLIVFVPVDGRRYRPPDAIVIGSTIAATIPIVVAPPVTVLAGTDWAAEMMAYAGGGG
jgi:hypothetical protein